ncbi:hypothetical protein [Marinobacter sp. 1_MG-2023]|uniref:hypothetical protein n=1 Tax=Marinobacter sp. 1_MG-2023 TaxID=3062627 RepID=UPI0026E2390C|nr:hypothetical protein [Marinobacter sp. 1_MG-2023]MDO6823932.1 hypothetical protein [Marinobacter sp. 1_MG-2023]
MSSRIDLTLSRCAAAGCLAAAPWLTAFTFALIAGTAGKNWMFILAPLALAGAIFQYRLNGLLAGPSAVLGLHQEQGTLYARLGNGRILAVNASPASRICSNVALLKLEPTTSTSSTYPVVLLSGKRIAGNVSEDQFRRLRMRLRLGRTQHSFE